jgi:hypothetical protein
MAKKKPWKMPKWMEQYREDFNNTGGNSIEDLHNDDHTTIFENAPRALLCVAVHAQVHLLEKLYGGYKLK